MTTIKIPASALGSYDQWDEGERAFGSAPDGQYANAVLAEGEPNTSLLASYKFDANPDILPPGSDISAVRICWAGGVVGGGNAPHPETGYDGAWLAVQTLDVFAYTSDGYMGVQPVQGTNTQRFGDETALDGYGLRVLDEGGATVPWSTTLLRLIFVSGMMRFLARSSYTDESGEFFSATREVRLDAVWLEVDCDIPLLVEVPLFSTYPVTAAPFVPATLSADTRYFQFAALRSVLPEEATITGLRAYVSGSTQDYTSGGDTDARLDFHEDLTVTLDSVIYPDFTATFAVAQELVAGPPSMPVYETLPLVYDVSVQSSGNSPFYVATVRLFVLYTMPAPVAVIGAEPTSGDAPLEVQFTDESTGIVTSRLWDFGDEYTSTAENPSHTYAAPGIYEVALSVAGPGGMDEVTATITVNVYIPPSPFFKGSVIPGKTPQEVVDYMVVAPEWTFSTNPNSALGYAASSAATCEQKGWRPQAGFWTKVGMRLAAEANLDPGTILVGLSRKYGS